MLGSRIWPPEDELMSLDARMEALNDSEVREGSMEALNDSKVQILILQVTILNHKYNCSRCPNHS